MGWEKKSMAGGTFLKFKEGSSYEGIYKGSRERKNPFGDGMLMDHFLEMDGAMSTLSSSSENLRITLPILPINTKVKIDMLVKKGRKMYDVFIDNGISDPVAPAANPWIDPTTDTSAEA